jgi:inhibitor of cysteine peptidase
MLSLMKLPLILTLLLILPIAGSSAALPALTEKDAGREVILQKGREFLVRLPANPTTGYSWNLSVMPSDILIQKRPPQYQPVEPQGKFLGSGGFERWHFRFTKPGIARLSFAYARSWEKGVSPVRVVKLNVITKR